MRAVLLAPGGEAELRDLPEPTPAPGRVLLDVEVCALGPLDLWPQAGEARVPGRALTARLAEPLVEAGLAAGTPVLVDPFVPCGDCPACRGLRPRACRRPALAGTPEEPGGLQTRLQATPARLWPLPDGLSPEAGALVPFLALALLGLELARPQPQEGVVVFGLGPVGLYAVQLARLMGCSPILGVDPLPGRSEAALDAGCDLAAADPAMVQEVAGGGLPVVLASAEAGESAMVAIETLAPGGRLAALGPGLPPLVLDAARPFTLHRRIHPEPPQLERALALAAGGRIELELAVSHRAALDMAPALLRRLAREPETVLTALIHLRR